MRVLILLLTSLLVGCAAKPADIVIEENQTPVVCVQEPRVDVINLHDTPPTSVLREPFLLDDEGRPVKVNPDAEWGWWFDSELYAALAENLQAMRKNARQLRAITRYYKSCMDDHNEALKAEENDE